MPLPSKSFLPSPVPSECSPSRAHPTPNTCSRIWPVPLLHFPLMLWTPSKLWSLSRERQLLQSSHYICFRQCALVDSKHRFRVLEYGIPREGYGDAEQRSRGPLAQSSRRRSASGERACGKILSATSGFRRGAMHFTHTTRARQGNDFVRSQFRARGRFMGGGRLQTTDSRPPIASNSAGRELGRC